MSSPINLQIFVGFLMFAVVFVTLEYWRPLRAKPAWRAGWVTDVIWYVAGCFVGHLSDTLSLGAMLLIRHAIGLNPTGLVASQWGWIQFVEILLIADFLAYWFHRTIHRIELLWRFHKIHHSSAYMDWLANVRLHPIDKILGDAFQFVPIFFLGFSDVPLFAYTAFLGFQGFLNHSNVKLNYGPLRRLIATPEFHHWHHAEIPEFYDKNFSPHLVIFDRLFGTFHLPPAELLPAKYGLSEVVPESFGGQLLFPFTASKIEAFREA